MKSILKWNGGQLIATNTQVGSGSFYSASALQLTGNMTINGPIDWVSGDLLLANGKTLTIANGASLLSRANGKITGASNLVSEGDITSSEINILT